MTDSRETLPALLAARAVDHTDTVAWAFDDDGTRREVRFGEAFVRVRRLASGLREAGFAGKPVVLLYPPGLDFVEAFQGCLMAGVIAVPAYPPEPHRLDRSLARLSAIAKDAGAVAVLATAEHVALASGLEEVAPALARLPWLASDTLSGNGSLPGVPADAVALLQYTSGSTADPKGVVVLHGTLVRNARQLIQATQTTTAARLGCWVPMYHDLGLVSGCVLGPVLGVPTIVRSPLSYLADPVGWFELASRERLTHWASPPFALSMLLRRRDDPRIATLDLSCVIGLAVGAEPVRAEVLDAVADLLAATGFSPRALCAGYGLAENVLTITASSPERGTRRVRVDKAALAESRIVRNDEGVTLVGNGPPCAGNEVRVIDPVSCTPCPPDRVGELWVRGPSVAEGYWGRPEETAATFGGRLADGTGPWLRTGDLGFLDEGDVVVTGRMKDLIILGGRNVYPQDLEATTETAHPAVRPGCVAAFPLETHDGEGYVVVAEIEPQRAEGGTGPVISAIRRALAAAWQAVPTHVVLVPPRGVRKTSSGKIARRPTAAAWREGALEVLAETTTAAPGDPVTAVLVELLGPEAATHPADAPLAQLGLDSLHAVELSAGLQALGFDADPVALLSGATRASLAPRLSRSSPAPVKHVPGRRVPVTQGEKGLLEQVEADPTRPGFHLVAPIALAGALDIAAMEAAVASLVQRHVALRYSFHGAGFEAYKLVHHGLSTPFEVRDLRGEENADAALRVLAATFAERPLPSDRPPQLRVLLVRIADEESVLLVSVHHLAADGWAFSVVLRDLAALYAFHAGKGPALAPVAYQHDAYSVAEAATRTPESMAEAAAHARAHCPPARLPWTAERPERAPWYARRASVAIPDDLQAALAGVAKRHGATPALVYLDACQQALAQALGQDDATIAVTRSDRLVPEHRYMVGLLATTVPVRGAPSLPLAARLSRLVREVLAAPPEARQRSLPPAPRHRVMFNFYQFDLAFELPGLTTLPRLDLAPPTGVWPIFDLMLLARDRPAPAIDVAYRDDILPRAWADALPQAVVDQLRAAVEGS